MNLDLLDDVLDPQGESYDALFAWINERIAAIRQTAFTPEILKTFAPIELHEDFNHPCGPEASASWRRFFVATLLADWASYERPVDRADFSRLKYIMTSAYTTTRLWGCVLSDGTFTPLGYTAWYPIATFVFEDVLNASKEIDDRGMILPSRRVAPEHATHGYVFNISVTPELYNVPCVRRLSLALRDDLIQKPQTTFLAISVNPATQRHFQIGQFLPAGTVTIQGETEHLYVRKPLK